MTRDYIMNEIDFEAADLFYKSVSKRCIGFTAPRTKIIEMIIMTIIMNVSLVLLWMVMVFIDSVIADESDDESNNITILA